MFKKILFKGRGGRRRHHLVSVAQAIVRYGRSSTATAKVSGTGSGTLKPRGAVTSRSPKRTTARAAPGSRTFAAVRRRSACPRASRYFGVGGFGGRRQALKAKDALELVASDCAQIAVHLHSSDEAAARSPSLPHKSLQPRRSRTPTAPGSPVGSEESGTTSRQCAPSPVLPYVVTASAELEPANLRLQAGLIRSQLLARVAPRVVAAEEVLLAPFDRVKAIATSELNVQIAEPVELMQAKLAEATWLSSKVSYAVRCCQRRAALRTYLVLFQNHAAVRATGGIPGAWAQMTVDDGRSALGRQGGSSALCQQPRRCCRSRRGGLALRGETGHLPQNVNYTPDFPRTAELAQTMWAKELGVEADGVISVAPVALSYLLCGNGGGGAARRDPAHRPQRGAAAAQRHLRPATGHQAAGRVLRQSHRGGFKRVSPATTGSTSPRPPATARGASGSTSRSP